MRDLRGCLRSLVSRGVVSVARPVRVIRRAHATDGRGQWSHPDIPSDPERLARAGSVGPGNRPIRTSGIRCWRISMQPDHDPESKSGSDLSPEAESTHTTSPVNSAPHTGRLKWLWAWVIPAALLAGGLAWIGGESTLTYFVLTDEEMKSGISGITPTDNAPYLRAKRRVAI